MGPIHAINAYVSVTNVVNFSETIENVSKIEFKFRKKIQKILNHNYLEL